MPPKKQSQSTLNLPKNRRNTKQLYQNKSIHDESIIRIGKQQQQQPTSTAKKLQIHQEHLDETDKLLRGFDLNYAFGPCVGMKRLERWERAHNLGLNPPAAVKDILMKDAAQKYAEPVFCQFRVI